MYVFVGEGGREERRVEPKFSPTEWEGEVRLFRAEIWLEREAKEKV